MDMSIHSKEVKALVLEIEETARQDLKSKRRYIDYDDNSSRISVARHTIVYGRRGSGKTTLLKELSKDGQLSDLIWIDAEQYKKLTFPNTLIQVFNLLINGLIGRLEIHRPKWYDLTKRSLRVQSDEIAQELGKYHKRFAMLLNDFDSSETKRSMSSSEQSELSMDVQVGRNATAGVSKRRIHSGTEEVTAQGRVEKLPVLDNMIQDFKAVVDRAIDAIPDDRTFVILDDFYHLRIRDQASILDYMARVLKNTRCFLKVGTISHRTNIYRSGKTIDGLQIGHDASEINLDKSFKNFESVIGFMRSFWVEFCKSAGVTEDHFSLFIGASWEQLVLASGGVPRDLLNIFVHAVNVAKSRSEKETKLTKRVINEAASLYLRSTKHQDLKGDALGTTDFLESLLSDIVTFCADQKKKNVFMIHTKDNNRTTAVTEALRQLCDFRFIHQLHDNMSSKDVPGERFEAFLLDVGLYAHPERRGKNRRVDEVAFWEKRDRPTSDALRSAPIYSVLPNYEDVQQDPFKEPLPEPDDVVCEAPSIPVAEQSNLFKEPD